MGLGLDLSLGLGGTSGNDDPLLRATTAMAHKQQIATALGANADQLESAKHEDGFLTSALGWLRRPSSAVVGLVTGTLGMDSATNTNINKLDPLRRAWAGLTGTQMGFGDFDGLKTKADDSWLTRGGKMVGAFALDTATDPLTYLTFGTGSLGRQGATVAAESYTRGLVPKLIDDAVKAGDNQLTDRLEALGKGHVDGLRAQAVSNKASALGDTDTVGWATQQVDDLINKRGLQSLIDGAEKTDPALKGAAKAFRDGDLGGLNAHLTRTLGREQADSTVAALTSNTDEITRLGRLGMTSDAIGYGAGQAVLKNGTRGFREFLIKNLGEEAGEAAFKAAPSQLRGGLGFRVPFAGVNPATGEMGFRAPLIGNRDLIPQVVSVGGGGQILGKTALGTNVMDYTNLARLKVQASAPVRAVGDRLNGRLGSLFGAAVKDAATDESARLAAKRAGNTVESVATGYYDKTAGFLADRAAKATGTGLIPTLTGAAARTFTPTQERAATDDLTRHTYGQWSFLRNLHNDLQFDAGTASSADQRVYAKIRQNLQRAEAHATGADLDKPTAEGIEKARTYTNDLFNDREAFDKINRDKLDTWQQFAYDAAADGFAMLDRWGGRLYSHGFEQGDVDHYLPLIANATMRDLEQRRAVGVSGRGATTHNPSKGRDSYFAVARDADGNVILNADGTVKMSPRSAGNINAELAEAGRAAKFEDDMLTVLSAYGSHANRSIGQVQMARRLKDSGFLVTSPVLEKVVGAAPAEVSSALAAATLRAATLEEARNTKIANTSHRLDAINAAAGARDADRAAQRADAEAEHQIAQAAHSANQDAVTTQADTLAALRNEENDLLTKASLLAADGTISDDELAELVTKHLGTAYKAGKSDRALRDELKRKLTASERELSYLKRRKQEHGYRGKRHVAELDHLTANNVDNTRKAIARGAKDLARAEKALADHLIKVSGTSYETEALEAAVADAREALDAAEAGALTIKQATADVKKLRTQTADLLEQAADDLDSRYAASGKPAMPAAGTAEHDYASEIVAELGASALRGKGNGGRRFDEWVDEIAEATGTNDPARAVAAYIDNVKRSRELRADVKHLRSPSSTADVSETAEASLAGAPDDVRMLLHGSLTDAASTLHALPHVQDLITDGAAKAARLEAARTAHAAATETRDLHIVDRAVAEGTTAQLTAVRDQARAALANATGKQTRRMKTEKGNIGRAADTVAKQDERRLAQLEKHVELQAEYAKVQARLNAAYGKGAAYQARRAITAEARDAAARLPRVTARREAAEATFEALRDTARQSRNALTRAANKAERVNSEKWAAEHEARATRDVEKLEKLRADTEAELAAEVLNPAKLADLAAAITEHAGDPVEAAGEFLAAAAQLKKSLKDHGAWDAAMKSTEKALKKKVVVGETKKQTHDILNEGLTRFSSTLANGELRANAEASKLLTNTFASREMMKIIDGWYAPAKVWDNKLWNSFLRPFMQIWKTSVTIGRGPGFVIRNVIGGVWNQMLHGLDVADLNATFAIVRAEEAARAQAWKDVRKAAGGSKRELTKFLKHSKTPNAVDYNALQARTEELVAEKLAGKKIGGVSLHEIYLARQAHNIVDGGNGADVLFTAGQADPGALHAAHDALLEGRTVNPLGLAGKNGDGQLGLGGTLATKLVDNFYIRAMSRTNELAERTLRTMTFTRGAREFGLADGGTMASQLTRLLQFDYADLSDFEQKLKVLVPFYVFSRNNLSLTLRMLAHEPGKITGLDHAQEALQNGLGADGDEQHLPLNGSVEGAGGFVTRLKVGDNHLSAYLPIGAYDLNNLLHANGLPDLTAAVGTLNPMFKSPLAAGLGVDPGTKQAFNPDGTSAPLPVRALKYLPGNPLDVHTNANGDVVANSAWVSAIRSLTPYYAVANNVIAPTTDNAQQRWLTSALSTVAGAPLQTITPEQATAMILTSGKRYDQLIKRLEGEQGLDREKVSEASQKSIAALRARLAAGQLKREE